MTTIRAPKPRTPIGSSSALPTTLAPGWSTRGLRAKFVSLIITLANT